jgi:hypothetical protein
MHSAAMWQPASMHPRAGALGTYASERGGHELNSLLLGMLSRSRPHQCCQASPAMMLPVNASMDCRLGDTHVTAPAAVGLKRRYLQNHNTHKHKP